MEGQEQIEDENNVCTTCGVEMCDHDNSCDYYLMYQELYDLKNKKKPAEYIICAAIHYEDGKVYSYQPENIKTGLTISGRRHKNCFVTVALLGAVHLNAHKTTSGFITNKHRFVDRQEAYKIAFEADQIIGPNKGYPTNSIGLTSEDLY